MHVAALAKINLHLRVGPPTANGFHPLVSWMCTIGLADRLTVTSAAKTTLSCNDPALPCDEQNLVLRAVRALEREMRASGRRLPGIAIALQKNIPAGGGLGGGSSDAATTLTMIDEQFGLGLSSAALHRLAAGLGSDVPFFLHGPSAICTGRGEFVQTIARPKSKAALLVLPGIALPTPAVYRKFDELRLGDASDRATEPPWAEWVELSAERLLPNLRNDLEPAAFAIEAGLAALRSDLEQTLGRPVRMSGSGSSLFTLFDEMQAAESAARIALPGVRLLAVELAP